MHLFMLLKRDPAHVYLSFLQALSPPPWRGVKAPRLCAGASKCVTQVDERRPRPTYSNWGTISDSTAGALTPRGEMPISLLHTLSLDVFTLIFPSMILNLRLNVFIS